MAPRTVHVCATPRPSLRPRELEMTSANIRRAFIEWSAARTHIGPLRTYEDMRKDVDWGPWWRT